MYKKTFSMEEKKIIFTEFLDLKPILRNHMKIFVLSLLFYLNKIHTS